MAQKFEKKYAFAVSSGTAALHLLLRTIIDGYNDEILVSGLTCRDITNAIQLAGGKAIYLGVDSHNKVYLKDIEKKINSNTKGIIIDHLFGKRTCIRGLEHLKIRIIEDCTHNYSSHYKNADVIASFGATKLISGCEGGIILTGNPEVKEMIRDYLSYEAKLRYPYKLSDIHSGIAMKQLEELESYKDKRLEIAHRYNRHFCRFEGVILPDERDYDVFYRYIIEFRDRRSADYFVSYCKVHGVNCEIAMDPHEKAIELASILESSNRMVSVPIYPSLNKMQQSKVIRTVNAVLDKMSKI